MLGEPMILLSPGFGPVLLSFVPPGDLFSLALLNKKWTAALLYGPSSQADAEQSPEEAVVRKILRSANRKSALWTLCESVSGNSLAVLLRLALQKAQMEKIRTLDVALETAACALLELDLPHHERIPKELWPSRVRPTPPDTPHEVLVKGVLFEKFMRAFFELCARLNANETYRAWRGSDFVDAFRVYVVEELRRRPSGFSDLGERFCKEIYDDYLAVYEHWEGGYIHWGKIPWRRSAIEWFKLVLGQSTADAFGFTTVEIDRVDREIRDVHADAMELFVSRIPIGIPVSHWWFNSRGGSWVRNH